MLVVPAIQAGGGRGGGGTRGAPRGADDGQPKSDENEPIRLHRNFKWWGAVAEGINEKPPPTAGAYIEFFKNGVSQGRAFENVPYSGCRA